jgi:hypothetical protein
MEDIYSKLNVVADSSFLRKSNKDRKEEYKHMKIVEEIKRTEEAERYENLNEWEKEKEKEKENKGERMSETKFDKGEKEREKTNIKKSSVGLFSTQIN